MTITGTPAQPTTDRSAPRRHRDGVAARSGGSRPLAALTVTAPLLLGTSIALHPDDTHGAEHTITAIAGEEKLQWALVHLAEPAAWLLLGATLLLALPRLAGARGSRLLSTAGVFAAIGFSALAMLVYAHGEAFMFMAASGVEPAVYAPLFEQFESGFPLAAIPSLLGRVGLLVAAVGLIRARTLPVWAGPLLLVPAFALGSTGGLPLALGLAIVLGPLVVVLGTAARRIATTGGPALHTGS